MQYLYPQAFSVGATRPTEESRCAAERGHATPDMKGRCFVCGYPFTAEELQARGGAAAPVAKPERPDNLHRRTGAPAFIKSRK